MKYDKYLLYFKYIISPRKIESYQSHRRFREQNDKLLKLYQDLVIYTLKYFSMALQEEIDFLRIKLAELESKKQELIEKDRMNKEISNNLAILNQAIKTREEQVKKNDYSKSCIVAKFIDRDMIPPLQAIYDILKALNERIGMLESMLQNLYIN